MVRFENSSISTAAQMFSAKVGVPTQPSAVAFDLFSETSEVRIPEPLVRRHWVGRVNTPCASPKTKKRVRGSRFTSSANSAPTRAQCRRLARIAPFAHRISTAPRAKAYSPIQLAGHTDL